MWSGVGIRSKHSRITRARRQNWNGLTAGGVFAGALISRSSYATSHNAESISVACSRSPSTKLSIFLSTLVRVVSVVESSTHTNASWSMYGPLISSYLRLYQYIVDSCDVPGSPRCKSAERFFNNVALCQFTAYLIQSQTLQLGDVVLQ